MPYPWIKVAPQQIPLQQISGTSLKIFLYIGSLIDFEKSVTIPISCIAAFFGLSKRHTIRCLHELCKAGLLRKVSEDNAILRVHVLKGISVGKNHPGEDAGSVRDTIEWGNVDAYRRKSDDIPVTR